MRNGVQLRDVFYAHKSLGVFAVQDNGDVPSGWSVYPVDKSINTPIHGISEFFNLSGIRSARDWYLTIDRSGILLNNGSFGKPPITWSINDIWQRYNFAQYHKGVLVVDEQHHKIYCAVPLDAVTENNLLLNLKSPKYYKEFELYAIDVTTKEKKIFPITHSLRQSPCPFRIHRFNLLDFNLLGAASL